MTRQAVKLPAEVVTVEIGGSFEKITCAELMVPAGENGHPVIHRVEVDQFNNLRVVENAGTFRLYHADTWTQVRAEERVAFEAVRDAS